MRLTPNQLSTRDLELDWIIAQNFYHAESKQGWADFSPTSDWSAGGPLIEKFKIDIRYNELDSYSERTFPWIAWVEGKGPSGYPRHFSESGPTPLLAAMKALVKSINYS